MTMVCSVGSCSNRRVGRSQATFHRFPLSDQERLGKWLAVLRLDPDVSKWMFSRRYVCGAHFLPSDFIMSKSRGRQRTRLRQTAVPSVALDGPQGPCDKGEPGEPAPAGASDSDDPSLDCESEDQELWFDAADEDPAEGAGSPGLITHTLQVHAPCSPGPPGTSGVPLSFKLNGQPVSFQPGGGGVDLVLLGLPQGSASGFSSLRGSCGPSSIAPLSAPPPAALLDPSLIISDVLCGEAAEKVLSDHRLNFPTHNPLLSSPPAPERLPQALSPVRSASRGPDVARLSPPSAARGRQKPATSSDELRPGSRGPVKPPDCQDCGSKFQMVDQLRGFMCKCSPELSLRLKLLRKFVSRRRFKSRGSKNKKIFRSPSAFRLRRSVPKGPQDQPSPPDTTASLSRAPTPPDGRMVFLVEDFYYGTDDTRRPQSRRCSNPPKVYTCIHCGATLHSNTQLMLHMEQHATTQQEDVVECHTSCASCYRTFSSPFRLQRHLEAVHSGGPSTAVCRICELSFDDEMEFLQHMKNTHRPGEMPYECQVCGFQSSFHSSVLCHFQQVHAGSINLLCFYCLKVLRCSSAFQQHFARHQRKLVFSCNKCRLHFLHHSERRQHKTTHHKTHIKPPRLEGLPPGTKVTVRTYSVVEGGERDGEPSSPPPSTSKVLDEPPAPPPVRWAVQNPGLMPSTLCGKSSVRCVECLSDVTDVSLHFSTLLRCSLCRYVSCCSRASANHMTSAPVRGSSSTKHKAMFQPYPRLSCCVTCASCSFATRTGDLMAAHLTEQPEHGTAHLTEQPEHEAANLTEQPDHEAAAIPSPDSTFPEQRWRTGRCRISRLGHSVDGAFIPLHPLPPGSSAQLSVNTLSSSTALHSSATAPLQQEVSAGSAGVVTELQLRAVLSALCNGFPAAALSFHTPAVEIQSWRREREWQVEQQVKQSAWTRDTERLAEWVLVHRERQLPVEEQHLLQEAKEALAGSHPEEAGGRYGWLVDMMLHHQLSLQPCSATWRSLLPPRLKSQSQGFLRELSNKRCRLRSASLGFMDELPLFLETDASGGRGSAPSLRFVGAGEKRSFDVVLSGLDDGTFLKPMLFFRGPAPVLPEGFPENVLLEARAEGFAEQRRLQIWVEKVWRPWVEREGGGRAVLVMDQHRGHQDGGFLSALSSARTEAALIPVGCSRCLQPLDICVAPVVREFLQARWSQLQLQGGAEGLGVDQLALTLCCWLSEVASALAEMPNVLSRSSALVSAPRRQEPQQDWVETLHMVRTLTEALHPPQELYGPSGDSTEMPDWMEEGEEEGEGGGGWEETLSSSSQSDTESFFSFESHISDWVM